MVKGLGKSLLFSGSVAPRLDGKMTNLMVSHPDGDRVWH